MKQLDIAENHKVSYCIPLWLRDEQIKLSIARAKGKISPHQEKRTEPIAVVCYGPSLNDTWQELKNFKYVMTCSGAHKFLLERGIVPTWHAEVDPRPHKVQLIGPPHKDVEYLIASTCHQAVWDHLEEFNTKLWHVFDSQEDAIRTLPEGEWALTGGCSVGLRTMTIARFFGFTDIHVFGMDGSEGSTGKHAAEHPNQAPNGSFFVEYKGTKYFTNPGFLEAAKQTFHELDQMSDVKATFYGEGLVQAMAKDYEPKPGKGTKIAFAKPNLITPEYRKLNQELHKSRLDYGVGGGRHADTVKKMMGADSKIKSVLDYGCGKGYLAKALGFPIWEYDPAIPGKEESPKPADLVVCADVLEHVEPDRINFVLLDLARCVKRVGYFVIHTGPSSKTLADGRNAHVLQKPKDWWQKKLAKLFVVGKIFEVGPELHIIVGPKPAKK